MHCHAQLGELQKLDLTGVRLILVNAYEEYDDRGSEQQMRAQLRQRGIRWPVVNGDAALRDAFGVRKIPSLFVYDRDGALVAAFRRQERPVPGAEELSSYLSSP